MIKQLIKLANHLDKKGLTKEADYLDAVIRKIATNSVFYYKSPKTTTTGKESFDLWAENQHGFFKWEGELSPDWVLVCTQKEMASGGGCWDKLPTNRGSELSISDIKKVNSKVAPLDSGRKK